MEKKRYKRESLEKLLQRIDLHCEDETPVWLTKKYVDKAVDKFNFSDVGQFEETIPTHFTKGKICRMRNKSGKFREKNLPAVSFGYMITPFNVEDYLDRIKIIAITLYTDQMVDLKWKKNSPLENVYLKNKSNVKHWLNIRQIA